MTRPGADQQAEQGSTIFLVAAAMLVLLGFAAIALDLAGAGFNERRQDQSAADVGALAAVQFAVPRNIGNSECGAFSGVTLSRCNGAVAAIEVATATLDNPVASAWADSSLCATPPAGYTVSPVTNCVAFSSNNQRAWVRVPTVSQPTTFARAIGFESIEVSAEAIAGSRLTDPGAVLPFLLPGNAASGDYNCLKTGGTPDFGPCEELPTQGNFGAMDFFMYGNEDLDWTPGCTGDTNGRFATNIYRGVDHPLGIHPTGSGAGVSESGSCPDYSAEPNTVFSQPGNGAAFERGMLYGGNDYSPTRTYPGRIQDSGGFLVRNSQGQTPAAMIDNIPLWDYLLDDPPGTACDAVSDPSSMDTCIAWAKATSTVVFKSGADGLVTARRFGWTPSLWEDDASNPSTEYHLKGYVPVYIDTTMFACTSTRCVIMHTPGVTESGACPTNPSEIRITCGTPGAGNRGLVASTAYVLSADIVPDEAKTPSPGSQNQRSFSLVE